MKTNQTINRTLLTTRPSRPLAYLIDMDGVIYRGGTLIPGALEFIESLRRLDIPFRFLTNNSQRTRRDVAARLQRLGMNVDDEHVYTCADRHGAVPGQAEAAGHGLRHRRGRFAQRAA